MPRATSRRDTSRANRLRHVQQERIRLTQHFLDNCDAETITAECRHQAAILIDTIIERFPDCPRFASLLVDRLLAGQEGLEQALRDEQCE